ncbi:hypothetical protein C2U72_07860 [Prosthecomicrobium hirschii]|nr:hypothetical protein C2U72_07860 [Prosthecomicrobium hirschii]
MRRPRRWRRRRPPMRPRPRLPIRPRPIRRRAIRIPIRIWPARACRCHRPRCRSVRSSDRPRRWAASTTS